MIKSKILKYHQHLNIKNNLYNYITIIKSNFSSTKDNDQNKSKSSSHPKKLKEISDTLEYLNIYQKKSSSSDKKESKSKKEASKNQKPKPETVDYSDIVKEAEYLTKHHFDGEFDEAGFYDDEKYNNIDKEGFYHGTIKNINVNPFDDLENIPDTWEEYNEFTKKIDKIDLMKMPDDEIEDFSKEALAVRWDDENRPHCDRDLPIAIRDPKTRDAVFQQIGGPNSTPKDISKLVEGQEPEVDPWIVEQFSKLKRVDGKVTGVFDLLAHPRTLKAAYEYMRKMYPTEISEHISDADIMKLSESLRNKTYRPQKYKPAPKNPYRDDEFRNAKVPKPVDEAD